MVAEELVEVTDDEGLEVVVEEFLWVPLGVEDVPDCGLSATKAIVAIAMITAIIRTARIIPMALRLFIKSS